MKKILILGGTHFQIPAIKYAKSQGYYVITCDYLPENPGHQFADEYHNVSTTDKDAVLSLSKELNIDGVLCFASDPAASTAAYVSEKLGLPGNSLAKIEVLGEKHHWRRFLLKNGFNTPKAKAYSNLEDLLNDNWDYPVMVKPVDSSGSKGVTKVTLKKELEKAFDYALNFSRVKIVIVEEYIERIGSQIGGDGFFGKDKLEFVCFGDQVVDKSINSYVPCGMTFPSQITKEISEKIAKEIERAIKLLGLEYLSFNLEVMIDNRERIFLMEIGPRNGGNCIPEVIYNYTQVNMVGLAVEAAMGNEFLIAPKYSEKVHAYYAIHSNRDGIYSGYTMSGEFKGKITESYIFKELGDQVGEFHGSNATIGILLLEFETLDDMSIFFANPKKFIKLIID